MEQFAALAVAAAEAGVILLDDPTLGPRILDGRVINRAGPMRTTIPLETKPDAAPVATIAVNGQEIQALVDTGSARTMITYPAALRLGVRPIAKPAPVGENPQVHHKRPTDAIFSSDAVSLAGSVTQFLTVTDRLTLAGIELTAVPMWVPEFEHPFSHAATATGAPVEAILGYDVLGQFAQVQLDYGAAALHLTVDGAYLADPERLLASAKMIRDIVVPLVPAKLDGRRLLVVADSGGAFGLLVPNLLGIRLGLPAIEDTRGTENNHGLDLGIALAGVTTVKAAGEHDLLIGDLTAHFVEVLLTKTYSRELDPPFAFLGAKVLSRYRVTLDNRSDVIYFERP